MDPKTPADSVPSLPDRMIETGDGLVWDLSEAEGEPFDLSAPPDPDAPDDDADE